MNRLLKIGALKKDNNSQWVAPTFIIPKINGTVNSSLTSELNKTIKIKPIPIPKHSRFIPQIRRF